jgi:hypothetical protein
MDFTVHARGGGKRIKVNDRIGGAEAFNQFLDPDQVATVTVASNDSQTGDVDILAQMRADAPWTITNEDYRVKAGETVDVDDV